MANHNRRPNEMTMIQGTNVNIGYANLNQTNQQINEATLERRYALDLLRANCSLSAIVDANERYDSPRCAEATRHNIMQEMEDWVRHDGPQDAPSSIFWLYGGAGVGKSALAQTLAEKFKTNEDLAASFFFFKADANRNDGNRLIPTLAYQLVQSFQGLAPFVEEKILQNPDLFQKSRQTQMLEFLIEPLTRLAVEETNNMQSNGALNLHPRLIVIDGLDECSDGDTQCDLLRIIADTIPHLPYPLRFLITSRPESHITRIFQRDLKKVARYNLSDDSDANEDIRTFLEGEFAKIRNTHPLQQHLPSQWPPQGSVCSLVERSSSHFIYASTVIRFIGSPKHRPDDRLQVILGLKQPYEMDRPYARLDSLYSLIFLEIQDPVQLERIHCAFGILHLRSLKRGFFASSRWVSDCHLIEDLLELRPGDLVLLFDPLLSLVSIDTDDIRIFHKSLFDYLLDSGRSGDIKLDLASAHETAANYILKENKLQMTWDSTGFQIFAYHCQFARLNDTLTKHLRSLACDPKITFTGSLSRVGKSPFLLQSILCFLQVTGRQDFDSTGHCYQKYVEKKNQYLRSAVPLRQRLRCMRSKLTRLEVLRKSASFERNLRLSLEVIFEPLSLNDLQRKGTNGLNGRTSIPAVDTSVTKSIEQEHEMFSSYVRVHHQYPNIVVSFLESSTELIHSCHFVVSVETAVTFVMLVTYTEYGVRLSCSEFEGSISLHDYCFRENISILVEKHFGRTLSEVDNNLTMVYSSDLRPQRSTNAP